MRVMNAALVVLVALLGTFLEAAEPDMAVLPATMRGIVLLPDGQTPLRNVSVRLWNADTDEVVFNTQTDKYGVFEIPQLLEGNSYITLGSVRIDVRVLTARAGTVPQPHSLVLVMPKQAPLMPVMIPGLMGAAALPQVMSY